MGFYVMLCHVDEMIDDENDLMNIFICIVQ